MPYQPPPYLAELSLTQIAEEVAARRLPPVESWSPEKQGDSQMRIEADGRWLHEGAPIRREAMVRAFSSLLTRDETGTHWLVTPFEKLRIDVADAAFLAVDVALRDGALAFRLNTDELVVAGAEHPLHSKGPRDTPAIYLDVRRGCKARLNRSTWGQLVDIALAQSSKNAPEQLAVTSNGETFALVSPS